MPVRARKEGSTPPPPSLDEPPIPGEFQRGGAQPFGRRKSDTSSSCVADRRGVVIACLCQRVARVGGYGPASRRRRPVVRPSSPGAGPVVSRRADRLAIASAVTNTWLWYVTPIEPPRPVGSFGRYDVTLIRYVSADMDGRYYV